MIATSHRGLAHDVIDRQFLHISAYFRYMRHHLANRKLCGEVYSMSSLWGTEHAFSFNFLLCRELVMTVKIPVQERNTTCRIVASVGSLTHSVLIKRRPLCLSKWWHSNSCYDVDDIFARPLKDTTCSCSECVCNPWKGHWGCLWLATPCPKSHCNCNAFMSPT